MGDLFYQSICAICRPAVWVSSAPIVIGAEHTHRSGAYILAANHQSPYDIPLLMRHCQRAIDFVSIVEVFQNPLVAWFYGSMNAFPLDRSKPDSPTVRTILDRLSRGRVVGMFPEGGFRRGADSVIHSHRIQPGIGRIAKLANVPIIPCVIVGSSAYSKFASWLPLFRTKYGIHFGSPIAPHEDPGETERLVVDSLVMLHAQIICQLRPVDP